VFAKRKLVNPAPRFPFIKTQAESSSSLNGYSCSIFFSVSNAGCIEGGARRRTDGEPGWLECSPRYSYELLVPPESFEDIR
jgi:hypothetical protein